MTLIIFKVWFWKLIEKLQNVLWYLFSFIVFLMFFSGDPALLHVLIKKGLNISEVESMDIESLKKLNSQCGISGDLSRKSKVKKKIFLHSYFLSSMSGFLGIFLLLQQLLKGNIQKLHASLLVGNCPCHAFTQVKGCTGGFYHLVCRHGVSL